MVWQSRDRVWRPDLANSDESERARVGLCATCRLAVVQTSAKGGRFWRCRLAERDKRFLRYPPLPVLRCSGAVPGPPDVSDPDVGPAGPTLQ
jgi:hypothetical protein